MNYTVGYTHNGFFHLDDVMATAFLERVFPGIKIKRVSKVTEEMKSDKNAIIFDIGLGKFDHHQLEKGEKKSAFGKLYEEFGMNYIKSLSNEYGCLIYNKIYEKIVQPINKGDNYGYKVFNGMYYENEVIKDLNPTWDLKEKGKKIEYNAFRIAVNFADSILETNIVKELSRVTLTEDDVLFLNSCEKIYDDRIIIIDKIMGNEFAKNKTGNYLCALYKSYSKYKIKMNDKVFSKIFANIKKSRGIKNNSKLTKKDYMWLINKTMEEYDRNVV